MKKIIDKIKDKSKAKYIILLLVLIIGVTFAFVAAQISSGIFKNLDFLSDSTDQLEFEVTKELSLNATQFNLSSGGENLSDTAIARAKLKANSTNSTATYLYNVYLIIESNNFVYTTDNKKTEILLQITDPNGNQITEINGYNYDEELQGFDITEEEGVLAIAENYVINSESSNNFTIQDWTFKIVFVNLNSNQKENAGKNIVGKIKIQQKKEFDNDITIAAGDIPFSYGNVVNANCSGISANYNELYNRFELSQLTNKKANCKLSYSDRDTKNYLNDYIKSLNNITQGTGRVVNEKVPDYSKSVSVQYSNYVSLSQYSASSATASSGTEVTDIFTFNQDTSMWQSNVNNITAGTYYHFGFKVSESGYYQICFEAEKDTSTAYMYAFINNLQVVGITMYSNRSNCYSVGQLDTNDTIRVVHRIYNKGINFYLKQTKEFIAENDYRYEGQNPNNYIRFNNELWRIIGVFSENTHGQSGQELVKIIRVNSISGMVFSTNGSNDWTKSALNSLFNPISNVKGSGAYYYKQDGTGNSYCSGYSTNPIKCNYLYEGINPNYRKMIKEVTWHLGGLSNSATAENYYNESNSDLYYKYERMNLVYTDRPTHTTGYIGLMYPSDYGYSVLSNNCKRFVYLNNYGNNNFSYYCAAQTWLNNLGEEFFLTPGSYGGRYQFYRTYVGSISITSSPEYGSSARPTLYLDSSVYRISGTGTSANPYIIGM